MVIKTDYLKEVKAIRNIHNCNNCTINIYGAKTCNNELVTTYKKDIGYYKGVINGYLYKL